MGIDWATRAEIAQAIPPAYTEHIGGYLMACMTEGRRMTTDQGPPTGLLETRGATTRYGFTWGPMTVTRMAYVEGRGTARK